MTKPFPFQKDGIRQIQAFDGRTLLADEMGLGKSFQSIEWVRRRKSSTPVVIVCPAGLKWNWEHELRIHANLRAEILEGYKPIVGGFHTSHDIVIVNYKILESWLDWILKLKPQTVIFDEAHYVKNPRARRTKALKKLTKGVPHVIGLSGTPLTTRPAELFPILSIIRPDLYKSFFTFGARYCKPTFTPWGMQYKGASNLDELHTKLSKEMMIRRRKKEVLHDLPDKSRHIVLLDIERRKEYKRAVVDFIGWLRSQNQAKANRAKKAQHLVRTGYLLRLVTKLKHRLVYEWIDNYLAETDEKLVIFGVHQNLLGRLHKRYPSVLVNGTVHGRDRKLAIAKFHNHNKTKLFIGNFRAAGVGINLTCASNLAVVEFPWTPGELTQAEDRIHRIGQMNASQIFYLIGRDTIEHDLCRILQDKQSVLDAALDGSPDVIDLDIYTRLEEELMKGIA